MNSERIMQGHDLRVVVKRCKDLKVYTIKNKKDLCVANKLIHDFYYDMLFDAITMEWVETKEGEEE